MLTVGSIMTRKVVALHPDVTLEVARATLEAQHARQLPVVEHERVVGIVSALDLEERPPARPDSQLEHQHGPTVRDRMSRTVEMVRVDEAVTRACRRMLDRRIACLPVVGVRQLVGVLTEGDLLRLYAHVCRHTGRDPTLDPRIRVRARGELVVVSPEDGAADALDLCRAKGIRHLPVVRGGGIVGIVSDRDLYAAARGVEEDSKRVGELMTRSFVAIEAGTSLSIAAETMLGRGFHGLPVLSRGVLQGIVTSADVLEALSAVDESTLVEAWSSETAMGASVEES